MPDTSASIAKIPQASTLVNGGGRAGWRSEGPTETKGAYKAGGPGPGAGPGPSLSCLEADGDGPWVGVGRAPVPYLVDTGHNSALLDTAQIRKKECPDGRWLRGVCEHGTERWVWGPCKRRGCLVCGPVGRWRIAERIALGVITYWPCAWLVLTLRQDTEKKVVVRMVGELVRRLRRRMPGLQYATTYEVHRGGGPADGRLHVNLIAGPWALVPHKILRAMWGARVSVEWVKDGGAMGKEGAKSGSPGALGGYLSKLEQSVPEDRRVCYSKGWPKLPSGGLPRRGVITWSLPSVGQEAGFLGGRHGGHWKEIRPGEWASWYGEECDCFQLRGPGPPGGA